MIITCDACTKRYMLDAQAVGAEGRMVRCASCGHSWKIHPLKESVLDLFPENENEPLDKEKKPHKFHPSRWILVALLIIALSSLVIVGREHIVSFWPSTASYYKAAGLPIEPPGTGLTLQQVTVVPLAEKDTKELIVQGIVVNTTSEVKYLPSLKVKAFGGCTALSWWEKLLNNLKGGKHTNSSLCMIQSWKHSLPETRLFPGEKATFETSPEKTTHVITDLVVSF